MRFSDATNRQLVSRPVRGATTAGILIAAGVIAGAWVLTAAYIIWANRHYDPAVAITHIGGSSSDPTRVSAKLKNVYMWRSRYQVQRKCYGRAAAAAVRMCDILALSLRKTKMLLTGRRRSERVPL